VNPDDLPNEIEQPLLRSHAAARGPRSFAALAHPAAVSGTR
jgi:hypothetical protein